MVVGKNTLILIKAKNQMRNGNLEFSKPLTPSQLSTIKNGGSVTKTRVQVFTSMSDLKRYPRCAMLPAFQNVCQPFLPSFVYGVLFCYSVIFINMVIVFRYMTWREKRSAYYPSKRKSVSVLNPFHYSRFGSYGGWLIEWHEVNGNGIDFALTPDPAFPHRMPQSTVECETRSWLNDMLDLEVCSGHCATLDAIRANL